jgi:hypothetical protein
LRFIFKNIFSKINLLQLIAFIHDKELEKGIRLSTMAAPQQPE